MRRRSRVSCFACWVLLFCDEEELVDFFCFFDFCGPVMPASRREDLRRLSWEGGMAVGKSGKRVRCIAVFLVVASYPEIEIFFFKV